MRFWCLVFAFLFSTAVNAIDLEDHADGLDQAAHARLEAAFLFDQVQKQSAHIQASVENASTVEGRIALIREASHYAGWMSFHYGQMATAYPRDQRAAFSSYISCSEAAYTLQQVGYGP